MLPEGISNASRLSRALHGDLDNIILKALQKRPQDRYDSVGQLAEDIRNYLEFRPVLARPQSVYYRTLKFFRRNRLTSALMLLLAISIAVFTVSLINQSQQVIRERDLAYQERIKSDAVTDFISQIFKSVRPHIAQGQDVKVRQIIDDASEKLAQNKIQTLSNQPEVVAKIHTLLGTYLDLGLLEKAEQHLNHAKNYYYQVGVDNTEDLLRFLLVLSDLTSQKFDHKASNAISQHALKVSQQLHGDVHETTLGIMSTIAGDYNMMGRHQDALAMQQAIIDRQLTILAPDSLEVIASKVQLGIIHYWMGQFELAEPLFRQCLTIRTVELGEKHPETLRCLSVLGSMMETTAQYSQAEPFIRQHIDVASQVYGIEHPKVLRSMHNLADTLRGLERYDESETLFNETLSARIRVLGESHIETLQTKMKLARLLRLQARYREAQPLVESAVEHQTLALGFNDPTTLTAAFELANLYLAQSALTEAFDLYSRILDARKQLLLAGHPDIIVTLTALAQTCISQNRLECAQENLANAKHDASLNPTFDTLELTRLESELDRLNGLPVNNASTPDKTTGLN